MLWRIQLLVALIMTFQLLICRGWSSTYNSRDSNIQYLWTYLLQFVCSWVKIFHEPRFRSNPQGIPFLGGAIDHVTMLWFTRDTYTQRIPVFNGMTMSMRCFTAIQIGSFPQVSVGTKFNKKSLKSPLKCTCLIDQRLHQLPVASGYPKKRQEDLPFIYIFLYIQVHIPNKFGMGPFSVTPFTNWLSTRTPCVVGDRSLVVVPGCEASLSTTNWGASGEAQAALKWLEA